MEEIIPKLQEWIVLYGIRVVAAFVILFVGWLMAKGFRSLIRGLLHRWHVDETLVSFASSLSYFAVLGFAVIAMLGKLGVETASFVMVIGSAGLAIGLALQGSLANFAAGILLIIFKPFLAGDFIEGGGAMGTVIDIGIFTTKINSPDNKKIIIPNAKLTTEKIVNYTFQKTRRIDIVAGVSYSDDIDHVKQVLTDILSKDERILKDPPPMIGLMELGSSSVNFVVRPWVKTADYWPVFFATQESIKKRFDAEGISIPFPQQDVHLYKTDLRTVPAINQ